MLKYDELHSTATQNEENNFIPGRNQESISTLIFIIIILIIIITIILTILSIKKTKEN